MKHTFGASKMKWASPYEVCLPAHEMRWCVLLYNAVKRCFIYLYRPTFLYYNSAEISK